jgi:predicted MFS family arabinose efflux permease
VGIRLLGQAADGLFQASLVASVVFAPEGRSTAVGLFQAYLIVALPFTVLGPFVGVFLDRWPRRAVLIAAPLAKAALVAAALADPITAPWVFYPGALLVISVNRFQLAAAQAVVPRLVPAEDLLIANSISTVGGTVALLTGVFVGGQVIDALEASGPVIAAAAIAWVLASRIAASIRNELAPHALPEAPELLRHALRRVLVELRQGVRSIARTPRALGPITSITLDQIGQGVVLTLSLVVFREQLGAGVASFSNLIGAGAVGVLLGIATIGPLEERFRPERIVAGAFLLGGAALVTTSLLLTDATILLAAGVVGLAFAWKKIPVDTLVQGSLPDGLRGRVFAAYDVVYNAARALAAGIAIPLLPAAGTRGAIALVGALFLAWAPVLPRWIGRTPPLRVRLTPDRATVAWGCVEEPARVIDERTEGARRCVRLALTDGTLLDVSRPEPDGWWRIDREGG